MRLKRRNLWTIGVVVAVGFVAVLLVLIGAGVLVLPSGSTPARVTVASANFDLVQGTNASGKPWFGPSPIVYSGAVNGFPFTVAPGGSFSLALSLDNYDDAAHTLYSVTATAPFHYVSSSPGVPVVIPANEDSALMDMVFTAPSTGGTTLTIQVTLDLEPASP